MGAILPSEGENWEITNFFFRPKNIVELSVGRGVNPPKKDDRGEVEYSEDIQYSRTWIISVISVRSSHKGPR